MSRFAHLEFEGRDEDLGDSQALERGDIQYCEQASQAYDCGDFEIALRLYSRVLEFDAQSLRAWNGQIRSLIELCEFEEAVQLADKALKRFPGEAELLAAKGIAKGRQGARNEALALSDISLEEDTDNYYLWLARGDILISSGDTHGKSCIDHAIKLSNDAWRVIWHASRIYAYKCHYTYALEYAQRALALNPSNFALWLQQGKCQQNLGMIELAKKSIREAAVLRPHHAAVVRLSEEVLNLHATDRLGGWLKRILKR
jgi:tetratricopeptide (TPR) repeat protein